MPLVRYVQTWEKDLCVSKNAGVMVLPAACLAPMRNLTSMCVKDVAAM